MTQPRAGAMSRMTAKDVDQILAGANHGLHNDTTPRHDEPAVMLA